MARIKTFIMHNPLLNMLVHDVNNAVESLNVVDIKIMTIDKQFLAIIKYDPN